MRSKNIPWGFRWRSKSSFIVATVAIGLFTDLFLYGIVVPVLPLMLKDRLSVPASQIQSCTSGLLAAYAGASVLFSVPAGWVADNMGSRQRPFLAGLAVLFVATTLLAFGQVLAVLAVARALQGVAAAVVWTAGLAMVFDAVGPNRMGQAIGSVGFPVSRELVAPVLGGILYDTAGTTGVFAISIGVLVVDLIMRLLIIDSKTAARYDLTGDERPGAVSHCDPDTEEAIETDALLPMNEEEYKISGDRGRLTRTMPILCCLRNPRLIMALFLSLMQAVIIAAFDATIPLEAKSLFHFSSLKAGLLFIALDIPYLGLGHVSGWAVDRYGAKVVTVAGYGFLTPSLVLLGLPSKRLLTGDGNLFLFCAVLALNGVGIAIIASPAFVEASNVIRRYEKANPGLFGENGPYAQLYGLNSMFFYAGLAVGPPLSGMLRENFGYGVMAITFAVLAGTTAIVSFFVVGGPPRGALREPGR